MFERHLGSCVCPGLYVGHVPFSFFVSAHLLTSSSFVLSLLGVSCLCSCAGFAPLLLYAHFLKYSAGPLQPTQPRRIYKDCRSVDAHPSPLSSKPTHTHKAHIRSPSPHLYLSASSRSLLSTGEAGEVHPQTFSLSSVSWGFEDLRSLKEKLWAGTVVTTVHLQEHNNGDDYGSWQSRNM